jgi:beta-N-acetylhexosaminidase
MVCHRVAAIDKVYAELRRLPHAQTDRALVSVARFKHKMVKPAEFSEEEFRKINDEIWDLRVAVLGETRAKERSVEDGKRSPVELY